MPGSASAASRPNNTSESAGSARAALEALILRIVIVSNRLPIVIEQNGEGPRARPGSGGLITALAPVLRRNGGTWIGWPGAAATDEAGLARILADYGREAGYELRPVPMSQEELEGFYQGFCNEIIWPLFHDLQTHCNFDPEYWKQYLSVKARFAEVVRQNVEANDFVWIQDYHLMGLGQQLREAGMKNRLGFFLHIPFPPPDIFLKLPWRTEVLQSLLFHDLIGFQTPRDRENFVDCMKRLLPDAELRSAGRHTVECRLGDRTTRFGTFPIGIDYREFNDAASTEAVGARSKELRKQMLNQQIVLGVDRLDYTKGIPDRLRAFQLALRRYPELHGKMAMLQVVVPSREAVPKYQELKSSIEQLVTQINGEFTQPGWVPIQYVFRSIDRDELLAYYRVADVALVTPLKDGMNLVAKEYCACQVEGDGVLILSEFAGSAVQLQRGALLVNPFDLDRVAEAIHKAVSMTKELRSAPMRRLKRNIRRQDVFWWVRRFLGACGLSEGVERSRPALAGAVAGHDPDNERHEENHGNAA